MTASIATVLGFDFGMRKIGVAVGQTVTKTARPLTLIKAQDGIPKWDTIKKLIDDWKPDALVVGLPLTLDGGEQEISLAARKFSRRLKEKYNLPTHLMDERLTSKSATSELKQRADKKTSVDSVAATLILESWLREYKNEKT